MIIDSQIVYYMLLPVIFMTSILQVFDEMSSSSIRFFNSDIIDSRKVCGASKTAQWVLENSQNCNFTSTKVAITRLWTQYVKLRKTYGLNEGNKKLKNFLDTEFVPPQISKSTPRISESSYLISSGGDASSTAMLINKSLILENQSLVTEKSRLESEMSKQTSNIHCMSSYSEEVKKKNEILHEKLKDSKQETKRTKRREEYWKTKCTRLETSADSTVEECHKFISELQEENDDLNNVLRELRKILKEKEEEISVMSELLQEANKNDVIRLFNKKEKAFTPQLHLCVYTLLEHNVPATQIGPTIEACLKLAGKKPDHLPCQTTIANMNIQRLSLAKKQLEEILPEKKNTTLHTDETSKYGIKYGGFSVRDEDGSYFVLGLREMATKSAENTLDTFKDILEDISEANNKTLENTGNKILGNIQNTMSDRAATELKFNELLEIYRQSLLPQIRKDYNTLNNAGKEAVSRLNNFFCGLHGLVHMANAAQKSLFEAEMGNFQENPPICHEGFSKEGESGCFRVIRNACKAFARRGDEKSGCFGSFRTYMQPFLQQNGITSLPLQPFKGNRFNILFQNAACIFYLHSHMIDFLEKSCIESKRLLMSVLSDLKVSFYVAGLKALGLIAKLITTPLWNLLESRELSIESMSYHYLRLSTYLADASQDLPDFIKGKFPAFAPNNLNGDRIFESLISESKYDTDVEIILSIMLPSIRNVVLHVYKDHLPNGKYETFTEELSLLTKSVDKHNSFSERLFAYMDQILRSKPNISTLAIEAYTLFLLNKTSDWLLSKEENIDVLISEARKSVQTERSIFETRRREIQQKREERQEQEFQHKAEVQRKRLHRLEKQSDEIVFYGLWKSPQECKLKIKELNCVREKIKAIKAQLRYRKNVLKQCVTEKELYKFTKKGDNGKRYTLSYKELFANLLKVLKSI